MRATTGKVLGTKVTAGEYGEIWVKASKKGVTVSQYIKDLLFMPTPTMEVGGAVKFNILQEEEIKKNEKELEIKDKEIQDLKTKVSDYIKIKMKSESAKKDLEQALESVKKELSEFKNHNKQAFDKMQQEVVREYEERIKMADKYIEENRNLTSFAINTISIVRGCNKYKQPNNFEIVNDAIETDIKRNKIDSILRLKIQ